MDSIIQDNDSSIEITDKVNFWKTRFLLDKSLEALLLRLQNEWLGMLQFMFCTVVSNFKPLESRTILIPLINPTFNGDHSHYWLVHHDDDFINF